jgi:hypothetical protein
MQETTKGLLLLLLLGFLFAVGMYILISEIIDICIIEKDKKIKAAQAKALIEAIRSTLAFYYAKNGGKFPAKLAGSLFADGNIPTVETTRTCGSGIKSNNVIYGNGDGVVSDTEITDEGGWIYDVSPDLTKADIRINAKYMSAEEIPWYKY